MASKETICSKKRTATLVKKTSELATLCGTDALIIILEDNPTDPGGVQNRPIRSHTWPESSGEVHRILKRYQDYCRSNSREPKRRKVEEAGDVSADDSSVLLGLVESKISMVESRLRELEEDRIRCCGSAPEEPSIVPVAVDVCSDQAGSSGLEDNMFVCGAADSWDQMFSPMGVDFDWGLNVFPQDPWDEDSALMEFGCDYGVWL